jgi:hypothetical protein
MDVVSAKPIDMTSSLVHQPVGKITGTFVVPAYQRGYRWTTVEVTRLLDDIWEKEEGYYNLQPVVVKRHEAENGKQTREWELIDGQQRLTTLYLIFHYLKEAGLKHTGPSYVLRYQTRAGSAEYLKDLCREDHDANIDFYHLYKAFECIGQWFVGRREDLQEVADGIHDALLDQVRVIWYEAPAEMDSTTLFTRLNVGRIPLTDAELVKALLLSRLSALHLARAHEVASQWDMIERDLHSPEVWGFVAGDDKSYRDDGFATRISLLLDTLARMSQKLPPEFKMPRYHTFEVLRVIIERGPLEFWMQVLKLHDQILGWFNNRNLYHKIGFLVATGTRFSKLTAMASGQIKSQFEGLLDERIQQTLNVSRRELETLSYAAKGDYQKLLRLLFLMNVETLRTTGHTHQRFPFHLHVGTAWSLEHIHAQSAESLTTKEQWKAWLTQHQMALEGLAPATVNDQVSLLAGIQDALDKVESATNFNAVFQELVARVIKAFSAAQDGAKALDGMHAIGNLALLSRADNSLLSNSVFEVKRRHVLNLDSEGGYIPVCTRNVFLKYYTSSEGQQNHFWSLQDGKHYSEALIDKVNAYLSPDEPTK